MTYHPHEDHLMATYRRFPVTFVRGEGCRLVDIADRFYLDCLAGIGCMATGHSHPAVTAAIAEQAGELVQVSNLFSTLPQPALADRLAEITGWPDARVFFANSGAEANECAIKLVRKWAGPGRYEFVCAEGSFHGRTLATLAATGQPSKWAGFEPLPEGFVHVPFNDLDAFAGAVTDRTAAILVEPIFGEGGIVPAEPDFLAGLRDLADEKDIALVFDEIQTGMGRTGAWWAWQGYGVEPDVFTSAKALGGGLPIGACMALPRIAAAFGPGDHGTTFGGQPVPCAAGLATIEVLESGVVREVVKKGDELRRALDAVPHVTLVRGRGLMLAAVLDAPMAAEVVLAALERGLVVNAPSPDAVRWLPPLVIGMDEIAEAVHIFAEAVGEVLT